MNETEPPLYRPITYTTIMATQHCIFLCDTARRVRQELLTKVDKSLQKSTKPLEPLGSLENAGLLTESVMIEVGRYSPVRSTGTSTFNPLAYRHLSQAAGTLLGLSAFAERGK